MKICILLKLAYEYFSYMPFIYLHNYVPSFVFGYYFFYLFVRPSMHPSIHLCIHPTPIHQSAQPSIDLYRPLFLLMAYLQI